MRNAVRLLVVLALAGLAPTFGWAQSVKDLKQELARQLAANDIDAAAGTIARIGALDTADAADLIVQATFGHPSPDLYEAGQQALQGLTSAEARAWVIKEARKGKPQIRIGLYEVLARYEGDADAEQALIDGLAEKKIPQIVSTCARALARRLSKAAVEPLIAALVEAEKTKDVLWVDIITALNDITGKAFETADEWSRFWKIAGRDFDPQRDRASEDIQGTVARGAPSFFSEKVFSKRVMFIIDVSGSMREVDPPVEGEGGGKRIDRAKQQLEEVVRHLDEKAYFNILAFDDVIRRWQKNLQLAANRNKADAIVFVQGLRENGMTHTDEALKAAFEDPNINTIYLLTDGAPMKMDPRTGEQLLVNPQDILNQVATDNRFRKIKIHTMGFDAVANQQGGEALRQFLVDLAEQNGGRYTPIR